MAKKRKSKKKTTSKQPVQRNLHKLLELQGNFSMRERSENLEPKKYNRKVKHKTKDLE